MFSATGSSIGWVRSRGRAQRGSEPGQEDVLQHPHRHGQRRALLNHLGYIGHPVQPRPLEPLQPLRRRRPVPGHGRHVQGRLGARQQRLQPTHTDHSPPRPHRSGGSNGSRSRLWKLRLQDLADETGLAIHVCHFPPGTSKWNKIEHRLFCHITENWRGRPLVSQAVVVNLIGHTTTRTGLTIRAQLDKHSYPKGIKVSEEEFAAISIKPDRFHGDWNYTIQPTHYND